MICVDLSDILYPGGTLDENSYIVCALLPLLYAPAVTLHSTQITFTLIIMLIDMFDAISAAVVYASTRIPAAIQCCWTCPTKVYSVCTSNLASDHVAVCAERNRVFSTLTIIVIVVVVVVLVIVVIIITH